MNVLIFTVSAGDGHNQVASTLSDAILDTGDNHKVEIIEIFNYLNPKLQKILIKGYLGSIKYIPELYGYFYKKTEESDSSFYEVGELLNKAFLSKKLFKLLSDFEPDIIICTHPIPAEALSILKRNNKVFIPIITTITDYTLHPIWLSDEVDYYIFASDILKYELDYWQIPRSKAKFYGIPVRESFYNRASKKSLLSKLNLEDKFTAILMGGGLGLGKISETIDCILNNNIDIQLLVVTGKNEDLYNNLAENYMYENKFNNLKIFGYINNIDEFMGVSDVIITKPGGLTITEAIIKELPMIVTSNLPGQEERNTGFILNNGIGMIAPNESSLISCIRVLRHDSYKVNMIKENMRRLKKPKAAYDIADLILSLDKSKSNAI